MSSEPVTPTTPSPPPKEGLTSDEKNKRIAIGIIAAVAILFTVLNSQEVRVNWIITSWKTPLILVIVLATAAGGLAGWLLTKRRYRSPPT